MDREHWEYWATHRDDDGETAGYLKYWEDDDGVAQVEFLSVEEDYRHQGLASALMDRLEEEYSGRINHGGKTDAGEAWNEAYYAHRNTHPTDTN